MRALASRPLARLCCAALTRGPLWLFVALALASCRRGHHETAASAEEAVLQRQLEGLKALNAAADRGALVPFDRVLVMVDQSLVQELVRSALPYERLVAGKYRVRVTGVEVSFEDGFALVRLDGRATLADRPEEEAAADIRLYGALDIVELDPASGVLRGSVTVIALDARRVEILTVRSRVAEALVEDLGREKLEDFSALATRLEIPVKVESQVTLPAVGPEGGVRVEAATIPVRAGVTRVTAYRGRLWVSIAASPGTKP